MKLKRHSFLILLLALGCTAPDAPQLGKEEARARVGKGDIAIDFCEWMGWYDDGVCDDFCLEADPDCESDPYCYSDEDCTAGDVCNAAEVCLSPCTEGQICPAVCAGFCVAASPPDECWGAWIDPASGACRAPNDGIYPDECCEDQLRMCGGFANLPCPDDEWCDLSDPPGGASADMSGVCRPRPEACIAVFEPVCGRDGSTYGNACTANAGGIDVAHDGACE